MSRWHLGLLALSLATFSGCVQGTVGGPGATPAPSNSTTAMKPVLGPSEEQFSLVVPRLSTHLKQGESTTAMIEVSRGKNFDEDVTISMSGLPTGVTAAPETIIKRGETKLQVNLHAADDAAVGNHTINVTGHPSSGADAKASFNLTVDAK